MWPFNDKPRRLGLALGGGSARGIAHIGVLKVLSAEGIRPSAIAGTSMGAVVGAFAAAGFPAEEMESLALDMEVRDLVSFGDLALSRTAILNGEKVEEWLAKHLPETFEELELPFACVSVDLSEGTRVVHRSGDLRMAVRASISIPVVFMPVSRGSQVLVDGGLLEPVPVPALRELRASDVRVAVTVGGLGALRPGYGLPEESAQREGIGALFASLHEKDGERSPKVPGRMQIANASVELMQREIAESALKHASIVIAPAVEAYQGWEFPEAATLISLGEEAARKALPELRRRLRLQD